MKTSSDYALLFKITYFLLHPLYRATREENLSNFASVQEFAFTHMRYIISNNDARLIHATAWTLINEGNGASEKWLNNRFEIFNEAAVNAGIYLLHRLRSYD